MLDKQNSNNLTKVSIAKFARMNPTNRKGCIKLQINFIFLKILFLVSFKCFVFNEIRVNWPHFYSIECYFQSVFIYFDVKIFPLPYTLSRIQIRESSMRKFAGYKDAKDNYLHHSDLQGSPYSNTYIAQHIYT